MTDSLGAAVLAGLGGMVGWGFADFFAKKTIDRMGDVATLFWSQLFGLAPLLVLLAITRDMPDFEGIDGLWVALLGIGSAVSYLALYAGFARGSISVLSPVLGSEAAFTVIFSVLLFGEHIPGGQWVAIVIVLLGIVGISTTYDDFIAAVRGSGEGHVTAGLPHAVVGAVAFGLWVVMLDRFLGTREWLLFLLCIRASSTAAVFVFARVTGVELRFPADDPSLKWTAAAVGFCDTAAFAAVSFGLATTSRTAVVAVLSATFALPTMILARVFLKERIATSQKVAAAVILSGVALVSIH